VQEFPRSLKLITVWLLIGLLVFLGVQAFEHRAAQTRFQLDGGTIVIARGPDGHYHWPGRINGEAVDFLIDTGATSTAIPSRLAEQLGLPAQGTVRSSTAGGIVTGQLVLADIVLEGGVRAERLRVVALPGLGDRPLLGMDVLGRLRWSQEAGVLRIRTTPSP
jgi:aspartyl protease family protein